MAKKWQLLHGKVAERQRLIDQLLQNRSIPDETASQFLNPSYDSGLSDPFKLNDMRAAAQVVVSALKNQQKIAIYGDYDIDGLTATALLNTVFKSITNNVLPYIPDRFEEGYGLNKTAIQYLSKQGVQLIVTVDCGVNSADEIAYCRSLGMDIIITDHHSLPPKLSGQARAIVNPQLNPAESFSSLSGAGVAFYLVRAMQKLWPELLLPGQEKWLLDLVGLGTICDIVPLMGDNRVLARYGLTVLGQTRRPGLISLMEIAGCNPDDISETDVGFKLGPRLNAAGRLQHAKDALELLLTSDRPRGKHLAQKLNLLNQKRRTATESHLEQAKKLANQYRAQNVLVLANSDWNEGVVGIVAARVAEEFHKPTILLSRKGSRLKGSARSFGGFNLIEAIKQSSASLDKFGGHAYAAGMQLQTANLEAFRQKINAVAEELIKNQPIESFLMIDCELPEGLLDLATLKALRAMRPYGNSNPQPIFQSRLNVLGSRAVGRELSHLQLEFDSTAGGVKAIGFGLAKKFSPQPGEQWLVCYHLEENVWQARSSLQLEVVDMKLA